MLTDAGKNIVSQYWYDAWGNRTRTYGSSDITNRGYTAQEHLNEFGLINLNARLYDPKLGQFLGLDPQVADPGSTNGYNRYAYASNNPLMFVDLNGEEDLLHIFFPRNGGVSNPLIASMNNYGSSGSAYPRTSNPNNPNAGYSGGGATFGGGLNYGGGYSWGSGVAGAVVSTLFYLFSSHKGSAQLEATNIVLDPRYIQHQTAKPKPLQKPVGTGASTVYSGGGKSMRMDNTRVAVQSFFPVNQAMTAAVVKNVKQYFDQLGGVCFSGGNSGEGIGSKARYMDPWIIDMSELNGSISGDPKSRAEWWYEMSKKAANYLSFFRWNNNTPIRITKSLEDCDVVTGFKIRGCGQDIYYKNMQGKINSLFQSIYSDNNYIHYDINDTLHKTYKYTIYYRDHQKTEDSTFYYK